MNEKSEALRLADELSKSHLNHYINHAAAAELRRLHADNEALRRERDANLDTINVDNAIITRLRAQRDALLEALRTLLSYANVLEMRLADADGEHRAMQKARAAIAKAVEEQK